MERRRAIAVAGSTCVAALTAALAVAANLGVLGFGDDAAPVAAGPEPTQPAAPTTEAPVAQPVEPVVVTEVLYEDQYVVVPTAPPAAAPAPAPPPTATDAPPPTAAPPATAAPPPDSPPTTAPPSSRQSLPPGFRVPDDWPADEPYPPIPEGCERGQLEDDGHWNCEH